MSAYSTPPVDRSYVFVYGTLRRGERYHELLLGLKPQRSTWTAPEYELVSLGEYPAMLSGGQRAVFGEVYEVDDALLKLLDDLEDHPALYIRSQIVLPLDPDLGKVWCYLLPRSRLGGADAKFLCAISGGDWVQWREALESP